MKKRLLIAGGGTGGHLFPGLAVAGEWQARGGEVLFVGTQKGLEARLVPQKGFALEFVPISKLKGAGFWSRLSTLSFLPDALFKARRVLKKFRPDVVLGIGGYASGPAVVAALLKGVPTAVHEQNAAPGLTNRLLGRWVRKVLLNDAAAASHFNEKKIRVVGNPVASDRIPSVEIRRDDPPVLLICGGSQGAHAINEAFLNAVEDIHAVLPQCRFVVQTGLKDRDRVQKALQAKRVDAVVQDFFDDMPAQYAKAHLVICRAGAGTLSELGLWKLPAILVPYPFAADDHQKKNALSFVSHGGGLILEGADVNGGMFAKTVIDLLTDQSRLQQMAEASGRTAKPRAAAEVVDELEKLSA